MSAARLAGIASIALSLIGCGQARPIELDVVYEDGVQSLQFGSVEVGARLEKRVTVRNRGAEPILLETATWIRHEPAFLVLELPEAREIPGGGEAQVTVAFSPPWPGAFVGTFRIRARGEGGRGGEALAMVEGIGVPAVAVAQARIQVIPSPILDLGPVPFLDEARATKRAILRVFNAGSVGSRLRLERVEHRAIGAGTLNDELAVVLPPLPEDGLAAIAGENWLELEIAATPASLGDKRWELRLFSDDPERPEVAVEIVAEVLPPPACQLSIKPGSFAFGLISPPDYRDVAFTVTNTSASAREPCILWDFGIDQPLPAAASFMPAPPSVVLLEAGATFALRVRVQAPFNGKLDARVEFNTTSALASRVQLPITGSASAACLVIAPDEVDFGAAAVGCNSVNRVFNVYNTCAHPATLLAIELSAPAGQPAGGPDCPGPQPCPEFHLVQSPAIPAGGLTMPAGSAPVSFRVKYRPIDEGPDVGAVSVRWIGQADPVTDEATLRGEGSPYVFAEDTSLTPAAPAVDVLFVIDSSPAMSGHATPVASNLAWLGQQLLDGNLDAQVAVISADAAEPLTLRAGAGDPDPILTFNSTYVLGQLAAKVDVGTAGSSDQRCLERAVNSLASPANAGFLRQTAFLSVFCVISGPDSSPGTSMDHFNALQSLKPGLTGYRVAFNVLGPTTAACPGDSGILADTAAATAGLELEICSFEFDTTHRYQPRPARSFTLTSIPELQHGPIEVEVNGTLAPAQAWEYLPLSNAVLFDPLRAPPPLATVKVRYPYACFP